MSAPFGFDRTVIDALGWTLLHFIWQGALIAAAFATLNRALSRVAASTRYLIACATLVVMLLAPLTTFMVLRQSAPTPAISKVVATQTHTAPAASRRAPLRATSASWVARPRALEALTMSPRVTALFPWLVLAWSLGVIALSVRLLGGWWVVRRLQRSAANVALPEWHARLQSLARSLGVSRPVRLVRSALVKVPTVIGWLHPVILLPASTLTGLSVDQIESILAHELAHIRRHDYLVNLLQSLVETLLFYHPAVWWVSRRIREERELCCDDLAVGATGDPIVYAEALCRLERLRGEPQALAAAATGGSLLARIARLLGRPTPGHDQGARGLAVFLAAAAVVALMMGAQSSSGSRAAVAGSGRALRAAAAWSAAVASGIAAPGVAVEAKPALNGTLPLSQLAAVTATVPSMTLAPIAVAMSQMTVAQPWPALQPIAWAVDGSGETADEPTAEDDAEEKPGSRAQYTVDEWITLSHHGVDPKTVSRYEAALGRLKVDELVALANHGVSPEYVAKIRRGPLADLGTRDLIRLAEHGVTPEFVSGLGDLGAETSTDDLIRLAQHGISPEWYAAMRWMGYPDLTVDRAIRLADQGVSPEFASQLKIVGRGRFSLDELELMRQQGVTVEYVARMGHALNGLKARDLIQLRQQGVEPEFVAKMRIVGHFDAAELIALRQQGVEPEFAYGLIGAGYRNLSVADLIALRQQGVDAEFLSGITAAGFRNLSTGDLIQLRQQGVTGEFIAEVLKAGYPKASVSEIIRMRQQGLPCSSKR